MPLYLTEKELARLQGGAAPKERRERVSGPRSAPTGLSMLLLAGWCNEYNARMQMRLWRGDVTTAFYDDEREACDEAKHLARE